MTLDSMELEEMMFMLVIERFAGREGNWLAAKGGLGVDCVRLEGKGISNGEGSAWEMDSMGRLRERFLVVVVIEGALLVVFWFSISAPGTGFAPLGFCDFLLPFRLSMTKEILVSS